MEAWKRIFLLPLLSIYFVKRCPKLIGIMRRSAEEEVWSVTSHYQFQTLLEGDRMTHTQEMLTQETLLKQLSIFKEACDENEHASVSLIVNHN